jgi:hypothetical protein
VKKLTAGHFFIGRDGVSVGIDWKDSILAKDTLVDVLKGTGQSPAEFGFGMFHAYVTGTRVDVFGCSCKGMVVQMPTAARPRKKKPTA